MKKVALTVFVSLLLCVFTFGEENLVLNGDFENIYMDLPVHWTKDAWQTKDGYTRYYSESDGAISGSSYVTIENVNSNDARLVQTVIVKPLTVYRLSCRIKAENIGEKRTGANLSVMRANFFEISKDVRDTAGTWEYREFYVRTGPDQKTMTVAVRLGNFGNDNTGKASFDDFRLEEVKDTYGLEVKDIVSEDELAVFKKENGESNIIYIALSVVLFSVVIGFLIYFLLIKPRLKPGVGSLFTGIERGKDGTVSYSWRDVALAGILTGAYAITAFLNLGSLSAPQTYWRPASRGENVIVDFGKEQTVRRIYYFQGLVGGHGPDAKYEVDASPDGETWSHITSMGPDTIYYWYYKVTNVKARYMKITVEKPRSWLMEVVFTGEDITKPLPIVSVEAGDGLSQLDEGSIDNLFDEQDTFDPRPSHFSGMSPGFDEQYHGRTAMEHIQGRNPYEDTHPPLGKLIIALGILIFGMVPFGWRFMGTFFGILMVPLMYAFGKQLFKKTEYAFFAAFLMAVDFMHFTQTRIATIDTYGVFFIILMTYFMYRYYQTSYYRMKFYRTLIPLLLSGVCFGLGAASKWIAVYAVIGLFIIGILALVKKWTEYRMMKDRLASGEFESAPEEQLRVETVTGRFWLYTMTTIVLGVVVFFFVIPVTIYTLAFLPLWAVPEIGKNPHNPSFLGWVYSTVWGMIDYHSRNMEHPFVSRWWEWPIMTRPMWYHVANGLPPGQTQRLYAFGNPAVWWTGSLAAVVITIVSFFGCFVRFYLVMDRSPGNLTIKKVLFRFLREGFTKGDGRIVILIALGSQYLPWVISPRTCTFIYHFFASVPFIILCIIYCVRAAKERLVPFIERKMRDGIRKNMVIKGINVTIYVYFLIALILFIMFYPIIAGVPFDTNYIRFWLQWIPNWRFV
ncbi:MAG: phospholipid carrier-dependent glycosyltransferase [Spirochaetales bacterium]|nr:phospholipid carrier-dependent glycosyltransferase [Spirochaetales bacterium]